jgi:uroporphyrinogen-III synthase
MRKLLLLRPEPGLSASAERARAMGLEVVTCPLFQVEPVRWEMPEPANYDGLLLTSANAVRHGGAGLRALKSLPVHAVGATTAAAAKEAGFRIQTVGGGNLGDLLGELPISLRLLHLTGKDRSVGPVDRHIDTLIAYRSVQIEAPGLPNLEGLVAVVHSPRAGRRLAELATAHHRTAIAAISAAAADACGDGWDRIEVPDRPDDSSLLALAAMLCHTSPPA